jgi:uncharacterized protein YaaR (DUF327 family)
MRIDEKTGSRRIGKKGQGSETKRVVDAGSALFADRLTLVARGNADYAGELQLLKEEIDRAGDLLEQEATIVNFKAFRERIGTMARRVSTEAYRIEQVGGASGRSHEVLTVIDKEADLLYHLVMREQKDHIRIVAQILKIRGLVVDILL